MRLFSTSLFVTAPVVLAAAISGQAVVPFLGNKVQLSDGGQFVYFYSSPSIGGTVGSPILNGDIAYKGVPGNRLRSASGTIDVTVLEEIFIGDVDWPGGAPDYFDIGFGNSSALTGASLDHLAPDFFTTGSITALLTLGPSGLPHPCVISPTTTCSGSAGCPPAVSGYVVDVLLSSPITLPTSNDDLTGVYLSSHLPGGMLFGATAAVGACGLGDYVFQGANSQTEEQADLLNQAGAAWCEGFQFGGAPGAASGALPSADFGMSEVRFGIAEPIIEPVITDLSYGPVRGGASLAVDTSTGTATIGAYVSADPSLAGSLVFPAASTIALPLPASVFGANLLIAPTAVFNSTLAAWSGTGALVAAGGVPATQAEATTIPLPLPILSTTVYLQGFIVTGFGPITAVETTSWAIDLR